VLGFEVIREDSMAQNGRQDRAGASPGHLASAVRLAPRSAIWLGGCIGLGAPLLLTVRARELLALASYTLPVGVVLSIGVHIALIALLRRHGSNSQDARVEATHALAPIGIVGLAPVVLLVPASNLPIMLAVVAAGLCLYRLCHLARRLAPSNRERRLERAIFLTVFLVAWTALFQIEIVHDAFQYYAFLPSIGLDGDLDFWDQVYLHNTGRSYNPFPIDSARYIGTAVVQAPFFAAGHAAAVFLNRLGSDYALNGYTVPYRFFVSLASGLFGLAGLILCYFLAREWFPRRDAMMATLAVWLASPLVFFMFCWNGWAHPFAHFFAAAFLLSWQKTRTGRTLNQWILLGVLTGLLCLIRPSLGVLLVFPLIEWLSLLRRPSTGDRRFRALVAGPALASLAAMVVFSPQLSLWKSTAGAWFATPYAEVGDTHDWLHPDFLGLLFSTEQHGLFAWTPLLLVAAVGVVTLFRRDRLLGIGAATAIAATAYMYACWSIWWSGIGFSNRFFIGLTPLFVLGLCGAIASLGRVLTRERLWALLLCAVAWNLVLVADYRSERLPQGIAGPARVVDEPLTFGRLARANLGLAGADPTPAWRDWQRDGFVTERLANFVQFRSLSGLGSLLAASVILGLLATLLLRSIFELERAMPRHRLLSRVVLVSLTATLALHGTIGIAAQRTAPRADFYSFTESFVVAQQPGADVWLHSDYDLPVTSVDLLSYLIYGHAIRQGTPVAAVTVFDDSERATTRLVRAGIHSAETSHLRPEYRDAIQHGLAATIIVRDLPSHEYSSDAYDTLTFHATLDLPAPVVVRKVRIRYLLPVGRLVVTDMFLRDN